ncbi:hypothetical protein MAPG_09238 [Magnaporthiopsis poae ATCC 64411]|uniref:CBM1 domain-containing protein n=1 Tax=Magnaporthiopsis poae (strain ATCC 64411 / 73-15) TaxID=644358 RepID=A0A0C4E9F4_MAGP6|nr:hypothetical protein MAPG_09238 [Magnaporthiopsis poae ATCC 64411]
MQIKLFTLSILVPGGLAQGEKKPPNPPYGATQSMWGQCGGRTYAGARACPTGAYCRFDGNEWYQQCVPNDYPNHNDSPGKQPGGPGIITRTITTVITLDNPRPTRVTTYITWLEPKPAPPVTLVPDQPWRPDE